MSQATRQSGGYGAHRGVLRVVYCCIALVVWALTLGGRLRRRRFVVLCYHGVLDEQRERFASQMSRLRRRAAAVEALGSTQPGRGRPRAIVTFDDAFANLIPNALPALAKNDVPAMIFAVTENLGDRPRWTMPSGHPERFERVMTEEELRAAAAAPGVAIGSHTATHPRLDSISRDQLERELATSRQRLSTLLESDIVDLALPHGAWNDGVLRAATSAGYLRIYTLEHDLEPSELGEGVIGRFSASPDLWTLEFRLMIDGAYGWLGGLRRAVRRMRRGRARGQSNNAPAEAPA